MLKFTILAKPISLNPVLRANRYVRNELNDDWKELTWHTLRLAKLPRQVEPPLEIFYIVYDTVKPIDSDNNGAGKMITDALKEWFGIDDDFKTVLWTHGASRKGSPPRIEVFIYDKTDCENRGTDPEREPS